MSPLEPIARTAASGKRLWKPDLGARPSRRETYPFEIPVWNDRKHNVRAQFHVLCRIVFEIDRFDREPFGIAFRPRILIYALDRATMEVRAVVREVFCREPSTSREGAYRLGNRLSLAAFEEMTRDGMTQGAYDRVIRAVEGGGEWNDGGQEEHPGDGTSPEEEGHVREADS